MWNRILGVFLALALIIGVPAFIPSLAAAEGEPVKIELMNWNGGSEQKAQQEAIDEYMKANPNVTIELTTVSDGTYMAKLNTLVAAGSTPDIYYIAETSAIQWGLNGVALDLKPLYAAQDIDMTEHFIPASLFGADDKVYGLAYGVVNLVMYYNKALFDEKGIAYPSLDPANPITWEEYVDLAKKLTFDADGKTPNDDGFNADNTVTYGTMLNAWFPLVDALLFSNDARFFTEDGMDLAMDKPEGQAVIQAMADLYLKDKVAPSLAMNDALPGNVQMMKDNQLAMALGGSFSYPNFVDEGIDVGVAPLPMFKAPHTVSWASCNEISATTQNVDEVFKFFRWFCEAETNPRQILSNFPNAKAYYTNPELTDQWLSNPIFNDDFKKGHPRLLPGRHHADPRTRDGAERRRNAGRDHHAHARHRMDGRVHGGGRHGRDPRQADGAIQGSLVSGALRAFGEGELFPLRASSPSGAG